MFLAINVPSSAVKYILFQRTGYLVFPKTKLFRMLNKLSLGLFYNTAVTLESILRKEKVKQSFIADMFNEYEDIKSWLPGKCSAILDIGCGCGGIDVLLYRHYKCDRRIDFYLLDKTSIAREIYYDFEERGAFYNSFDVTQRLLFQNGIPTENMHFLEVTPDYRINARVGIDLVISLFSWGFHYPVSTYIDQVHDILRQGGHVIIDIRKNTDGLKELEQKFAKVQIISETKKRIRVSAIK